MPIDPSIALNIKPVQLQNPLEQYGQVAHLQHLASQNRLADLMFGEKQREVEQNNAMNELYKSAIGADGQIDRAKLITGAAQGGLGSRIPAMQKSLSEADKAAYETQKLKIESNLKQLDLVGQVAGSVKDQQSFERAKAILASQGIPTNGMGDTYNPQIVEQIATMALSAKDRLANEWKAKEFDLDQQKFAETKRSNQATEGISRGNLAVAQGNLGVSRERLNFDKSQPKGQYDAERGVIVDPRTGVARQVTGADGQPLAAKDKLTESQGKSTAFAARMQNADSIINDLASSGTKTPSLVKQGAEGVPLIGGALGVAANKFVATPAQQKMEQAQRDFVNAVLRQESGAAISASEFDNARKQYFPQPGDSSAVIQQKAQNRRIAIEGMKTQSGPGAAKIGGILQSNGSTAAPSNASIKFLGFE